MVELICKRLKHHFTSDELPTTKRRAVEAFVYATLITIVARWRVYLRS